MRRIIFICLFCLTATVVFGQDGKPVIQFTGVVMETDTASVIPGVHIYIPKGGRGTTSNPYGFFSLPVIEGDSIIFTAVGFKRTYFIVPKHDPSTSLKTIITLKEDMTFLDEVEVFPFPTEEMFKQAVVTMQLPYNRDNANIQAWLNATYMQNGYTNLSASPAMNQRYFQEQQVLQFQNRFGPQPNNLLNPWAWSSAIRSLKSR